MSMRTWITNVGTSISTILKAASAFVRPRPVNLWEGVWENGKVPWIFIFVEHLVPFLPVAE